jgi:hypothetical protein
MSTFKIEVSINEELFKTKIQKEIIYFTRGDKKYKDNVTYAKDKITIYGSRTNDNYNEHMLETVSSTFYSSLVKSLLYVYFEKKSYKIEHIKIELDGQQIKEYGKDEIKQVFTKDKKLAINCNVLFGDKTVSDIVMNSLMCMTLSFNNEESRFDYAWKCFNCLIREIFKKSNDSENLRSLRVDLEKNTNTYKNILSFAKDKDYEYLNECQIIAMFCNIISKSGTKNLIEFLKDFKDERVNMILRYKMVSIKKDLESAGEYNNLELYYKGKINEKKRVDSDFVRLVILKYAYYLRCKYFHAEKLPAHFLVSNMNDKELIRISEPLLIICKDLIENKLYEANKIKTD